MLPEEFERQVKETCKLLDSEIASVYTSLVKLHDRIEELKPFGYPLVEFIQQTLIVRTIFEKMQSEFKTMDEELLNIFRSYNCNPASIDKYIDAIL